MKKIIFSIILLLQTLPANSTFITGTIYQLNQNFIVSLGDHHLTPGDTEKQTNDLLESLKKFNQNDILALVEDSLSYDQIDPKYKEAVDTFIFLTNTNPNVKLIKEVSPIIGLAITTRNENIPTINVESRYVQNAFVAGIKNLSGKDILNEFYGEIKKIEKKYKKDISELKLEFEKIILDFYTNEISKTLQKNHATIETLKNGIPFEERQKLMSQIIDISTPLIDINILHQIIKNKGKKIIVICSGLVHNKNVENILEQIGYKKIKGDESTEINIADLFKHITKQKIEISSGNCLYKCSFCKLLNNKKTIKSCAQCHKALYCDRECQKRHWRKHRKVCKKK